MPFFKYLNKTIVVISLVGLTIVSGAFVTNSFLSMYRVFYYFPLFAIGYFINDLDLLIRRLFGFRWIVVFGFVLGVLSIFYFSYSNPDFNTTINYALTPDMNYEGELMNVIGYAVFVQRY